MSWTHLQYTNDTVKGQFHHTIANFYKFGKNIIFIIEQRHKIHTNILFSFFKIYKVIFALSLSEFLVSGDLQA